jgi:lipopolysaccharide transport system permease protein
MATEKQPDAQNLSPSINDLPATDESFTLIQPTTGWAKLKLHELWEYRDLLFFLTWRDIKVRYKQTILGIIWAILQPIFSMIIFSIVFGRMAGIPSDGVPYPIFAYAALIPWTFFANGLNQSTESLILSSNMIKKVYFPRIILPASSVLTGLLDFLFAFIVLIAMMLFYGIVPTWNILWLPLLLLLGLITSLGAGIWLTSLNVQFRDVRYVTPFLIQAWLFATPIVYPSSLLQQPWQTLYSINPMVGVVEGFRWALLGVDTQPGPLIIVSTIVALGFLISGVVYFHRMERTFADVV